MWEQNETGLEGELSEDIGPPILRGFGRLGDDPELALGMVNKRHGMASGCSDGPATTQEVHLMVGIDASSEVQGQMEIHQAGVGARTHDIAFFFLSLGASVVGGQAGGAADGAILTGQLAGEQFLGGGVIGDLLIGQKRDEALLEGAKTAFDFSFGLRAGGDQMGDAQGGEGALELRARIAAIACGLMAEQGQAIGVEGHGQAVEGESAAEVLEVVPGWCRWERRRRPGVCGNGRPR